MLIKPSAIEQHRHRKRDAYHDRIGESFSEGAEQSAEKCSETTAAFRGAIFSRDTLPSDFHRFTEQRSKKERIRPATGRITVSNVARPVKKRGGGGDFCREGRGSCNRFICAFDRLGLAIYEPCSPKRHRARYRCGPSSVCRETEVSRNARPSLAITSARDLPSGGAGRKNRALSRRHPEIGAIQGKLGGRRRRGTQRN